MWEKIAQNVSHVWYAPKNVQHTSKPNGISYKPSIYKLYNCSIYTVDETTNCKYLRKCWSEFKCNKYSLAGIHLHVHKMWDVNCELWEPFSSAAMLSVWRTSHPIDPSPIYYLLRFGVVGFWWIDAVKPVCDVISWQNIPTLHNVWPASLVKLIKRFQLSLCMTNFIPRNRNVCIK